MKTRKLLLFAGLTLFLVFGAAEAALWLAGVTPLAAERDPFQGFADDVRIYEPDPARGVMHTVRAAVQHSFNYQEFRQQKPAQGYRVFVLGGSSAWGFPWGGRVAFPHLLGQALQAVRPERTVEVVNAAGMSYGSHRLRIVAREVLRYEPDALVVFEGHNEFVERRFYRDLLEGPGALDRLRAALSRLRTFSALTRGYERLGRRSAEGAEGATAGQLLGLDVAREYSTGVGEAEWQEAEQHFERNLSAILDAAEAQGVRVVLCTVPSNVREWVPNESRFSASVGLLKRQELLRLVSEARTGLERGDPDDALAKLERARSIDGGHAEAQFRLGQAYEAMGRWDDARQAYTAARDLDGKPARAASRFNATIRRLAARRGVVLVDVERAFEQASPHGLVGFDLIEDYVHPKPVGHRLAAREIWKAMLENGLLGDPHQADPARFDQSVGPAVEDAAAPDAGTEARTPALLFNLAVVLENQGRIEQAMETYRGCFALDPRYTPARANLGRLLTRQGRFREAVEVYRQALEIAPEHMGSLIGLGEALRQLGALAEAREIFERASRVDARSARAWNRLGVTLTQLGALEAAERPLVRSIELEPRDADARTDLGFHWLARGRIADAEREFTAALELESHHLRGRNGLGAVRAEQGRLDEAERLFRESLALDPADPYARRALELLKTRR